MLTNIFLTILRRSFDGNKKKKNDVAVLLEYAGSRRGLTF